MSSFSSLCNIPLNDIVVFSQDCLGFIFLSNSIYEVTKQSDARTVKLHVVYHTKSNLYSLLRCYYSPCFLQGSNHMLTKKTNNVTTILTL